MTSLTHHPTKGFLISQAMRCRKPILLVCLLALAACAEDVRTAEKPAPALSSGKDDVRALFAQLATAPDRYPVAATSPATLACTGGAEIITGSETFLAEQKFAMQDTVLLEVLELYTKQAMICNDAVPATGKRLAALAGRVLLRASRNGEAVGIDPARCKVLMPACNKPSQQGLALYQAEGFERVQPQLDWLSHTSEAMLKGQDSSGAWSFYPNSDPGQAGSCAVQLSGSFNSSNTAVFLSMDGGPALIRLYPPKDRISQTFSSAGRALPSGLHYTIIALGFDGSRLYQASQGLTLSGTMELRLPPLAPSDKSRILALLGTL